MAGTFAIQQVKPIPRIGKKILRSRKHAAAKLRVIDAKCIGYDQMRTVINGYPVRQLIIIGVGVVEKAPFLDEETPRVDTRTIAAVPAQWPRPDGLLQGRNGLMDVLTLLGGVELVMFLPAPAVTADIIAGLHNCLGCRRMTFQRQGTAKDRQRYITRLKQA